MGKFAILKEIEYARDVLRLPYYYLGYYIESCPKMRYKVEYRPSELLCPVTYRWVDADVGKRLLLQNSPQRHCCQLYAGDDDDAAAAAGDAPLNSPAPGDHESASSTTASIAIVERIPMDVGAGYAVTLNDLQAQGRAVVEPILREFVEAAGATAAPRFTVAFR
jgi:arginine-tRNA-protein transferase